MQVPSSPSPIRLSRPCCDHEKADSSLTAAILLLQMKKEVSFPTEARIVSPVARRNTRVSLINSPVFIGKSYPTTPSTIDIGKVICKSRSRTVSLCSFDLDSDPVPGAASIEEVEDDEENDDEDMIVSEEVQGAAITKKGTNKTYVKRSTLRNKNKYVGNNLHVPIKAVLRKKFSWKNFPTLEAYLIENRGKYLHYSSQLNYTGEQRVYNNQLTQGLLDLAAEEGYIFEEFTFAAVRDRIRCYYKSCVQAAKKKKRKPYKANA